MHGLITLALMKPGIEREVQLKGLMNCPRSLNKEESKWDWYSGYQTSIPTFFLGSMVNCLLFPKMATKMSSIPVQICPFSIKMWNFIFPLLDLGCPCYLIWPMGYSRSDTTPRPGLGSCGHAETHRLDCRLPIDHVAQWDTCEGRGWVALQSTKVPDMAVKPFWMF